MSDNKLTAKQDTVKPLGRPGRKSTKVTSDSVAGTVNSELANVLEGVTYPTSIWVTNNTVSAIVEAELGIVIPAYSTREATARSHDQVQRAASNFEQLCLINGWHEGLIISNQPPATNATTE